ncbi:MAG: 2-hydroxychromene-2-carboxylate isomerase [Ralstonia sp.]|nr:2-hydroxychromene-2-carboxylate isomerase [Ralstonia sp.]
MSLAPEPARNPNSRLITDPPGWFRFLSSAIINRLIDPQRQTKRRAKAERARLKAGAPHRVEYFHQHDDPYSHLAQQVLDAFKERYDIELVIHQIRASGGKNQPELANLETWARRDAELIAAHYGLIRPSDMTDRWDTAPDDVALDEGSARLAKLGHYSGGMFYYAREWYWGIDRLFYLEQRLRDLGACKQPTLPYLCPRPNIDVSGADASQLALDFYPSLNSPYTSIIYGRTIAMARECGIQFNHKPVLPMVMRGVPATRQKGMYINFDTKREAGHLGVDFGPMMFPVGEPTRAIYSLIPWAREQGKDVALLSSALRLAWAEGAGLHRKTGLQQAVKRAGLDWNAAQQHLGSDAWKEETALCQLEMAQELGLWGVPSYRLRGGAGEDDLCVWGQDRLWLIAAEIRRRAALTAQPSGIAG